MKRIHTLALLLAAALSFQACSNNELENVEPATNDEGKTVTVRFAAENSIEEEDTTKATLTPNDAEDYFSAAWETSDRLGVYALYNGTRNNKNVPLKYNGTYFTGELTSNNAATTWSYYAYYPYHISNSEIAFGENRTQRGNEFNGAYDLMTGSVKDVSSTVPGQDADGKPVEIVMQRQTAILYFHFTTAEAWAATEKVSRVELVADKYISSLNDAKYSDSKYAFEIGSANRSTKIALTFEEGTAPTADNFKAYFNIFTASTDVKLTLTVYTENHKLTLNKSAATYEAGKLYRVNKAVPAEAWRDSAPKSLAAPELLDDAEHVVATTNSVTVKWEAVPNATGYSYSYIHPATQEPVSGTTPSALITIESLAAETEYTFTLGVKALGDGADYLDSSESSQTYTITTTASSGDTTEPVTYTWSLSTPANATGENYYYDSTSGKKECLTFIGNNSKGSTDYVQLGGKSCDEGKIPTSRYFKFTATRSGIVSVEHSANGSSANTTRWTVITANGTEIASAKAEGEPASSNKAILSGTVTVTDQPVEVWIYCVKGDARYYSIEYKEL